jgi:catechol 2,3-dioxygenase-like lactoylglutathione lyase family enzyme
VKYNVSKNIGFQVNDVEKAKKFYEGVLGLTEPADSVVQEVEYTTDTNSIFLIPGEQNLGPVMELEVDDLDAAKEHLLANGCEVVRWHGKGKDCYVRDPFGMVFNVWEKRK